MYPPAREMARDLSLPAVEYFDEVGSTLDVAHERAAAGAAHGTLIIADAQTAGRGRLGRSWSSRPGAGIWLAIVLRPRDPESIAVVSIRTGLQIARGLEPLIGESLGLKWPNDVFRSGRKLAGILVEARWRGSDPDWVAVGIGLNVITPPDQPGAIGLEGTPVSRKEALYAIVPGVVEAGTRSGRLLAAELEEFSSRDVVRGRRLSSPAAGVATGIDGDGSLLVMTGEGVRAVHAGSVEFEGGR